MPRDLPDTVVQLTLELDNLSAVVRGLSAELQSFPTAGAAGGGAAGAGVFPGSPIPESIDLDVGAGTAALRGITGAGGTLFGSLAGGALSPIAPFLGLGLLFGTETGSRMAGEFANKLLERAPEIGAAIASGIVNFSVAATGSDSPRDLVLDAIIPGRVTGEARAGVDAQLQEDLRQINRDIQFRDQLRLDTQDLVRERQEIERRIRNNQDPGSNTLLQRIYDFLVPPAGAHPGPEPHPARDPAPEGGGIVIPPAYGSAESGFRGLARGTHSFSPGTLGEAYDFFTRAARAGTDFAGIGDDSTVGRLYGRTGRSLTEDVESGVDIARVGAAGVREGIDSLSFLDRLEERTVIATRRIDGLDAGLRSVGQSGGDALRGLVNRTNDWSQALGHVAQRMRDVALEISIIRPFENFLTKLIGGFIGGQIQNRDSLPGGPQFSPDGSIQITQTNYVGVDPPAVKRITDATLSAVEESRQRGRNRVTSPYYEGGR